MGLFNDEGGQFLGSSTMSKENLLKAITTLSTLWDTARSTGHAPWLGKACVPMIADLNLHLMLQPYLANQLFKDPVINGQGILGRCLISWPERLAGQRLYKAIDLTRDAKVQRYQQRITALLQKPWSLHKDGSLNPATLELSPVPVVPGLIFTTPSSASLASLASWPASSLSQARRRRMYCASRVRWPWLKRPVRWTKRTSSAPPR